MTAFCSKSFGALTGCCFLCNVVVIEDPFEHVYAFDLLVPQLMSQLSMRPEFHNDLVYDCTDICEICICSLNAKMCTHTSAIILMWKRELVAFLSLSS